jgi:hypothetical protein
MPITISRLTREFLFWPVITQNNLSSASAEVAFMTDLSSLPDTADWNDAVIVEDGDNYKVRILVGPDHIDSVDLTPAGSEPVDYQTWVRITDSPERPVRRPGVITVE